MFRSSDNNIPYESGFDKSNVGREWERRKYTCSKGDFAAGVFF
jgi:hypothetical protein